MLDEPVAAAELRVRRHAALAAKPRADLVEGIVEDRHLVGVEVLLDDEEPLLIQELLLLRCRCQCH
ncbi:MAG: hypothetical protein F4121_12350 [Acidimicrobiia bacterium]|nr:hypothetical protein [Acidimicrobiia bacterium]